MQVPAGNSYIRGQSCFVEGRELNIQLARVAGLDSRLAASEKELLDTRVLEPLNHVSSVTLHDTRRKRGRRAHPHQPFTCSLFHFFTDPFTRSPSQSCAGSSESD